jgi:SAM-dependent methyltransferase
MSVAIEHLFPSLDLSLIEGLAQAALQADAGMNGFDVAHTRLIESLEVGPQDEVAELSDVGELPFDNSEFDAVAVGLDAMHGPDSDRAATELLRVVKPGGRICLACASPESFLDRVNCAISLYAPAENTRIGRGFRGTREYMNKKFGVNAVALAARNRVVTFNYVSAEHWLANFRTSFAPLRRAYEIMSPDLSDQFSSELLALARSFATIVDEGIAIQVDYLEFLIHKGVVA